MINLVENFNTFIPSAAQKDLKSPKHVWPYILGSYLTEWTPVHAQMSRWSIWQETESEIWKQQEDGTVDWHKLLFTLCLREFFLTPNTFSWEYHIKHRLSRDSAYTSANASPTLWQTTFADCRGLGKLPSDLIAKWVATNYKPMNIIKDTCFALVLWVSLKKSYTNSHFLLTRPAECVKHIKSTQYFSPLSWVCLLMKQDTLNKNKKWVMIYCDHN